MASATTRTIERRFAPSRLAWAFVERQTNLWRRYWGWEVVWLVYGVVNTLAITFIAKQIGQQGIIGAADESRLVLFLLIGTLVWAYLSAVLDDLSLVIVWERWEGTIEHTLMAPVPRELHLAGMALFGVLHALVRTVLIFAMSIPFFTVDVSQANWLSAMVVLAVGSLSIGGLAILTGVLPLLYPERGEQMAFMMQAAILLISGVYYSVEVLPVWLRWLSHLSPATYILEGIRAAIIEGRGVRDLVGVLATLVVFGVVLIPLGMATFAWVERWAKKTGQLKRQG